MDKETLLLNLLLSTILAPLINTKMGLQRQFRQSIVLLIDIYPPPPLPSSTPSSTQLPPSIIAIPQQSHNASNIYINPILPVPQQTSTTPDRYIPPPKFLQLSPNISNFTMSNHIIQNISSSLYTKKI